MSPQSEKKPDKCPGLETLALNRARSGLAPPNEIYEAPNRPRGLVQVPGVGKAR